ncbi:MAG TPA: hypothetical protein VGM32_16835 [Rhodopila sp.]
MTFTLTVTSPLGAADVPMLLAAYNQALGGAGTTNPPSGAVNYFPSDPSLAPFPSPENSQQLVLNGAVSGEPYLKDSLGRVHTLIIQVGVAVYEVDGAVVNLSGSSSTPPGELIVRRGMVYLILSGTGIVQALGSNGGVYDATLPAAWAPGTSQVSTPTLPPLAPLPTPSAIAPGSSGKVVNCGLATPALPTITAGINACAAGDTLQVDPGTYKETLPAWHVPLHLIGTGVTIDGTGLDSTLAEGKGMMVPVADSIIEGFEIMGVGLQSTSADLTSAVRPDVGCGYLTLLNVHLHGNQCGLGQGGFECVMTVQNSLLENNGWPAGSPNAGFSHNLYVGSGVLTLTNTRSINPMGGHAIKSRCASFSAGGCTFSASDATCVDLPDGTTTVFAIANSSFSKSATDANHGVLSYCVESLTNGAAGGTITRGSMDLACPNPIIETQGGTIMLSNVARSGNPLTVQGTGTVVGL